jgi:hypothetical protein
MIYVKPWTQFFDLKGREDIPYSRSSNVTLRNIKLDCSVAFDVMSNIKQYHLKDFVFDNIRLAVTDAPKIRTDYVDGFTLIDVWVNGEEVK